MNKAMLIEKVISGYELFESLLGELNEGQIIQPGVIADWSVKDTVAHMVVHEQRMLKWMVERLQGGTPKEHQPYASPDEQLDALNLRIYLENANRSWMDVQRDWKSTHEKTLAWIQSVNEDAMFDASKLHLLDGEPLWAAVAANTYEHYEEHGRDIRVWMGKGQ
jgi:hypothetical protein